MTRLPAPRGARHADVVADCSDAEVCGALEDDLGWALGVVFRAYLKVASAAVENLPGGPRGYQVLAAVVHDLPDSQLALAQQVGVDRTVLTYLLDDLERAGLLTRQPDPTDRRARRVVVTDAGLALVADLDHRLRLAEDHVLGVLGEADRAVFRSLLQQVAVHADSADPVADPCQVVEEIRDAAPERTAPRRPRRAGRPRA